jgi:predicted esterase
MSEHVFLPRPTPSPARAPAAGLLLALLAGLLGFWPAVARADLIVFKDGFVVQGRLKRDMEALVDPGSRQWFAVAKLGGFFMVDDQARRVIFSASQVADAVKKDFTNASDIITHGHIVHAPGTRDLGEYWEVQSTGDFDKFWERPITLRTSHGPVKIDQRLTQLSPHYLRLEAKFWDWSAYYLTGEFPPEALRTLLYFHLARNGKKIKLGEADKRFQVFRFLVKAGCYEQAEKELDGIDADLPDQKYRVAGARETLAKLRAIQLSDDIERSSKAGQYRGAHLLLGRFARQKITAEQIGERRLNTVLSLQDKYRQAEQNLVLARRFLKELPRRVKDSGQKEMLGKAAETIAQELNLDAVSRLEGFIGMARQEERQRQAGKPPKQAPAELLAIGVSGWLLGNDAAEPKVDLALRLWEARAFVLQYLRTHRATDRRALLNRYQERPGIALDELTQMIRFLPPPEPETKPTPAARKMMVKLPQAQGETTYYLQLPPEYNHNRAYPVLFALHGSGGSAKDILRRLSDLAYRYGYILAAPEEILEQTVSEKPPVYTFAQEKHAKVLDVLNDLRRRFQVDSDRVFLFGFEEGGCMAYDVGLSHPDLFAGVIPMAARPMWYAVQYWTNAQYLPFYVVDGSLDGKNGKVHRKQFQEWVRCHYPALLIEYKGRGPEWFEGELPYIFDWMSFKKRFHPQRAVGVDGGVGLGGQEFKTLRPGDNHFYWLSTDAIRPDFQRTSLPWKGYRRPASLTARLGSANDLYLNTRGLKEITVWFPTALVNFEQPVSFRLNGALVRRKVVKPDLETLLKDLYERGDRQYLFLAREGFRFK